MLEPLMAPSRRQPQRLSRQRSIVFARRRQPLAPRVTRRHALRGMSLVELLVGVAIGLLIVSGGLFFMTGNWLEHRSLLLESRLTQDLRTAADLAIREVRRSGYWGASETGVWIPGRAAVASNPYDALTVTAESLAFRYSRDAAENDVVDTNEQFGLRLRNGVLELQLGSGNWQALTDGATVMVTALRVVPTTQWVSLEESCPVACPASSASCPPRLAVRDLALEINGRAVANAQVVRTVRSAARLRNDLVTGACPA